MFCFPLVRLPLVRFTNLFGRDLRISLWGVGLLPLSPWGTADRKWLFKFAAIVLFRLNASMIKQKKKPPPQILPSTFKARGIRQSSSFHHSDTFDLWQLGRPVVVVGWVLEWSFGTRGVLEEGVIGKLGALCTSEGLRCSSIVKPCTTSPVISFFRRLFLIRGMTVWGVGECWGRKV